MALTRETRELAQRLFDSEAAEDNASSEPTSSVIARVCEKLRQPLSAVVGVADYRSLISRALALAKLEVPTLGAVQVTTDGSLQGLGEISTQTDEAHTGGGGVILIAELLGLFLSFLGEALTLQLVQDISPHLEAIRQSDTPVPLEEILQEVAQLNNVSRRLELLASQQPRVEDALMSISGSVHNIATTLEILALIKKESKESENKVPRPHTRRSGPYLM
jgi:hypothetical protein